MTGSDVAAILINNLLMQATLLAWYLVKKYILINLCKIKIAEVTSDNVRYLEVLSTR